MADVDEVEEEVAIPVEVEVTIVGEAMVVAAVRTTQALPKRTSLAWATAMGR